MKSLKNKPKRQLKTKPADKVEDVPVDGPIKPEDQLILSPDVRIKTIQYVLIIIIDC